MSSAASSDTSPKARTRRRGGYSFLLRALLSLGADASRITLALCFLDSSCTRPDAFEESPNERRQTPTRICIDRESIFRTRVSYAEESRIARHLCFASLHLPRFSSSVWLSTAAASAYFGTGSSGTALTGGLNSGTTYSPQHFTQLDAMHFGASVSEIFPLHTSIVSRK